MPSELQNRPDLQRGDDRGRIYRIVRADAKRPTKRPHLSSASTAELVALLEHTNAWWRETSARLLYERQDAAAKVSLEHLANAAREPAARTCALWALAGQGGLSAETVERALGDPHAPVREQAVVLAEPMIGERAGMRAAVFALAADGDPRVRFRVALAIGGLESETAIAPLARIALKDVQDVWTRRAVATALPGHMAPLLLAILGAEPIASAAYGTPELQLVGELATIVGSRRSEPDVRQLLDVVCGDDAAGVAAHEVALVGLAEGLARRGGGLVAFVASLSDHASLESRLNAVFESATAAALDESLETGLRVAKLDLLQHARGERVAGACLRLVDESPSQTVRVRAAAALAGQPGELFAEALVECYPRQTPGVRRAILDALVAGPTAAGQLLEAVKSGHIARAELDAARENRLRQHADPAVQALAKEILAAAVPAERRAVLADYQKTLALEPDTTSGKKLFGQHCAACHHIGDLGVDVAPDISDSRVKTPQQLLTDILHPNQAIDNNYVSYTIATSDGNVHTGIIASETAGSITLRQAENKTLALLRADIETIRTTGVSLMPEGFEKNLSHQQMADLIGFIKNWRYLERAIPVTIGPEGQK
jgi:putative heme-binding domain-containing protein